jgi:hypothetical protein
MSFFGRGKPPVSNASLKDCNDAKELLREEYKQQLEANNAKVKLLEYEIKQLYLDINDYKEKLKNQRTKLEYFQTAAREKNLENKVAEQAFGPDYKSEKYIPFGAITKQALGMRGSGKRKTRCVRSRRRSTRKQVRGRRS